MSECVILTPVHHPYQWLAPVLQSQLDLHWPGHPTLVCAGLTGEEAGDLSVIPVNKPALPRDWCVFMHDACEALLQLGMTTCYLIPEEHPPLGPCNVQHLNETLPALLDELDASYISLLGWDNRRSVHYGHSLGKKYWDLCDLKPPLAPRFQLHPALWRLEALQICLNATLSRPNHSPWSFETICRNPHTPLPRRIKDGCYRVSAAAMSVRPPNTVQKDYRSLSHAVWKGLSGLTSWLPEETRKAAWKAMKFDHFFDDGPYPIYFGGVMSKGKLSRHYWRHLKRECLDINTPLVEAIREHFPDAT